MAHLTTSGSMHKPDQLHCPNDNKLSESSGSTKLIATEIRGSNDHFTKADINSEDMFPTLQVPTPKSQKQKLPSKPHPHATKGAKPTKSRRKRKTVNLDNPEGPRNRVEPLTLMSLPAELRVMILEFCFPERKVSFTTVARLPNVSQVCGEWRVETLRIYKMFYRYPRLGMLKKDFRNNEDPSRERKLDYLKKHPVLHSVLSPKLTELPPRFYFNPMVDTFEMDLDYGTFDDMLVDLAGCNCYNWAKFAIIFNKSSLQRVERLVLRDRFNWIVHSEFNVTVLLNMFPVLKHIKLHNKVLDGNSFSTITWAVPGGGAVVDNHDVYTSGEEMADGFKDQVKRYYSSTKRGTRNPLTPRSAPGSPMPKITSHTFYDMPTKKKYEIIWVNSFRFQDIPEQDIPEYEVWL